MRDETTTTVSLYRLGRRLGAHPDLLERLCESEGIPVDREGGVRCLDERHLGTLREALELWRHRPRPWGARRDRDRPA